MRLAAAVILLCATAACAVPRDRMERLWPGSAGSIFVVRDGHAADEPVPQCASALRWGGQVEARYRQESVEVFEDSTLSADARAWTRRFRVDGLSSGIELVVRIPLHDAGGRPLTVEVNGAAARAEPGALELVVQLARDEATIVTVRSAHAVQK